MVSLSNQIVKLIMKSRLFIIYYLLFIISISMSAASPSPRAQDIRNANNSQVACIESNGTVRDRNNSTIGRIESNGTIRDRNNSSIGRIESDGTVRDRNNSSMGSAKGVPRTWAAVFFFFNFF